jgi:hypothetical protein
MQLTRQQVKALLNVLSSDRPILTHTAISEYKGHIYLVATNSYTLSAIRLEDSLKELIGKSIDREDIIKWYKLASGKDMFTSETVRELAQDIDGTYPQWQPLIPTESEAIKQIGLDAKLLLVLQELAGGNNLTLQFYGDTKPVVAYSGDDIYLIMPIIKR